MLPERAGRRGAAAPELGLSSAGVSGGRDVRAGSGAAAAATMPWRGGPMAPEIWPPAPVMQVPRAPDSARPLPLLPAGGAPPGSTWRASLPARRRRRKDEA